MYQTANEPIQYKKRPLYRQTAREPRNKRVPIPSHAKNQGGRVRSWLGNNVGLLSIAIGWVLTFAMLLVAQDAECIETADAIAVVACAFFGFGLGWIMRDEREKW